MVWSIGGTCDSDSRTLFDIFVRDILAGRMEDNPVPAAVGKWEMPFEDRGLVYDYMLEVSSNYRINRHLNKDVMSIDEYNC